MRDKEVRITYPANQCRSILWREGLKDPGNSPAMVDKISYCGGFELI
jgi:hypothetical protein